MQQDLEPTILVIFGITGDLAQRKLLPAIYHLLKDNLLPEHTEIVGISRRDVTAKEVLDKTELCVLETDNVCDPDTIKLMESKLTMHQMDLTSDDDYNGLRTYLDQLEDKHGVCMNRLYYLSIPPQVYAPIVKRLGQRGLNESCQHGTAATRLLVEKPFGYDLESAKALIAETGQEFREEQIFRIDHYLAKETAQNILAFRFHNPIFEATWDKQHITSIEVVASEKIGIEGRAAFYEQVGALRDLIQSHLMQLLALTTMEQPATMTSDDIHKIKLELLQAVQPVPADKIDERTVRGQYDGYREEANNADSTTETFAQIQLYIDNPRWQNVPMTLRTGKALHEKKTSIALTFKRTAGSKHANKLTFHIQPNEGISVDLLVKRPGFTEDLQTATMDFSYQRTFDEQTTPIPALAENSVVHGEAGASGRNVPEGNGSRSYRERGTDPAGRTGAPGASEGRLAPVREPLHPDAYERVLVDAIRGDRTLFATSDEVLTSWRIVEPVVQAWSRNANSLRSYKKGTAGPATN